MTDKKKRKINSKYLKRYSIILVLFWSILLLAISIWDRQYKNKENFKNAYIYTKVGFDKDILYRRWVTMHGGVYVPVSEITEPNPYLDYIPDRDIITPSGKQLTLMNPAYMSRQINKLETEISDVRSHITSLKPIRPENKADDWEKRALEAFELGVKEIYSIDTINGREYFRLMRPFITEQGCLKCHARHGYKLNDIRGGISISYPMDAINTIGESRTNIHFGILFLLWILGIGSISMGYFRLKKMENKRTLSVLALESAYADLDIKVQERTAELSKAKKDWEVIFHSIGSPAQIIDPDHRITIVNDATLQLTELIGEKFIGKKCYEIFHCSEDLIPNCPLKIAISEKKTVDSEMFLEACNKFFIVSATPLFEKNGNIERFIHIMTDITDRKKTEQKLQKSEQNFKELLKSAPDPIIQVDSVGSIIFLNEQTIKLFGYSSDELSGKTIELLIPNGLREAHKKHRKTYEKNPIIRLMGTELELLAQKKDGSQFYVEVSLSPVNHGDEFRVTAIIRDISDRKKVEESLSESQELFRKALDLGVVGMATTDPYTYYFLSANKQLCEMIGYSEEELLKKTWAEITFPKEKVDEDAANVKKLMSGELRGYVMEKQYQHKDGHMIDITLSVQGVRKKDDTINYLIILINDITKRKNAEKELKKYRDHLEDLVAIRTDELEKEKIKALSADRLKSAFLATMSHELRTPLNSIIGFTGILLKELPGPLNKEQAKQLLMAKKSGHHLLNLINDVLDISKIEAGELVVSLSLFDFSNSINKVISFVQPLADEKNLKLQANISPDIKELSSDVRRVEQIFINLLTNAIKFTEQGMVEVESEIIDKNIITRIIDTGIGIDKEEIDKIFKPFSQIDTGITRNYEGTGLGLSITKKLLEKLGGTISLESELGVGSTFTVSLPLKT